MYCKWCEIVFPVFWLTVIKVSTTIILSSVVVNFYTHTWFERGMRGDMKEARPILIYAEH